jgi:hypothetical protein
MLEESDAELDFERMNLSRSSRLTEMQARAGTAEPAHFGGYDEGTQ